MNKDDRVKNAIEGIRDEYIEEAYEYRNFFNVRSFTMRIAIVVAVAAVIVLVYNLFLQDIPYVEKRTLKIYAGEMEVMLTDEFTVFSTGRINEDFSVSGLPFIFYIESEEIEKVRYSCKNQMISFYAPGQEFYDSKNFTVDYSRYGNNLAEEYDYYTCKSLVWNPENMLKMIKEKGSIKELSDVEKSDIIVMEVEYVDGKTDCFAVRIKLKDDGKFYANIQNYTVRETDEFMKGEDAISYQDMLAEEMETAKECEELIVETSKVYTEEQIDSIFNAAKEYYSTKHYMVTDMVLTDKDMTMYAENTDYAENELVYIHVWGSEIDENTWRHIIIGSKDDWYTCEIVSEGY